MIVPTTQDCINTIKDLTMTQHATPAHSSITFLTNQPTLPVLAQVAVTFAVLMTKWSVRQRSRKQLRHLTPEQLQDIGLSREDAHYEATLPFWRP